MDVGVEDGQVSDRVAQRRLIFIGLGGDRCHDESQKSEKGEAQLWHRVAPVHEIDVRRSCHSFRCPYMRVIVIVEGRPM